jgi:3,4-dihydroxy 2-butanone 4-phosphate synthase / GTP cyclohydrolase II
MNTNTIIADIQTIIQDIKQGKMVVLIDEEDRENEGDIVIASEFVTPEIINFMAKHARGLICLTLTRQHCAQLDLGLMVVSSGNGSQHGTNFTLSIEAAQGVTTGISAADRAKTIQAAIAKHANPNDIVQPGHVFPLMAADGGVLMRAGHTEAACDLADLAGLSPTGVICEIMNDDGTMARLPDLIPFAQQHGLNIGTISSLIEYRSQTESLITEVSRKPLNTPYGIFETILYTDKNTQQAHLAIVNGQPTPDTETLVRVHEPLSCYDLLSVDSRHSWSLHRSLEILAQHNPCVLICINCGNENTQNFIAEFTGNIQAPSKADLRTYGIGAQILKNLGVGNMRLLANPRRIPSMTGFGLHIVGYYS